MNYKIYFLNPYQEQTIELEIKYFKKAPLEVVEGKVGGISFMT